MTIKDFQNVQKLYEDLKTRWERKRPDWQDISHFVGIRVDADYINQRGSSQDNARDLDEFVDDPTSAISVNQGGDYLSGVMWGTGDNVFDLVPSRYVTELVDPQTVEDFYSFATDQSLYHINHSSAGFSTALGSYSYDQFAFGTAGIGAFKNKGFVEAVDENALIFNDYGVDNTMIDEGKAGQVEIVFSIYNWKVNRIVGEFAKTNGVIDLAKVAKLPKEIREAYASNNFNDQFQIVFGFYPREDFHPTLKGKRGTRYRGVWFMDDQNDGKPFFEEDFAERPVAMARAIKVRGETYGRAPGTMLISTIRSVNFMVGTSIEIVEKMSNPALGMLNNAIFGDAALDTSPDGLTIFNQALAQASGGNPIFPIHDVGNPEAILNFLVPYLNEKIVTAFKIDALLDFSSAKEMTATESLQRFAIRGKSLAGLLLQQKNEMLVPITKRSVSLLLAMGELGVDPSKEAERAARLKIAGRSERVIPQAVLDVIASGRPWYEIKWNNELEKLTRTEVVQNLIQMIQAITAIAALYPQIVAAVDWYKLLKDINDNLDYNSQILISADDFKEQIAAAAQAQQAQAAIQAGQAGSEIQKNTSQA
ncbi:hypothetical protein KAR91_25370, partial [Candidatus Pacearchaeota archaeon]|nr:hypothetical protein [Candidatus Pacearchaeota archaeon]